MNLKVDKSVKNFLLDFGLTDKEITVYTTLLKTGPNTIMNLARETGIKRSTTHNTVEELIKKGLVSQTNYGERRMVIAEDPDKLKFLMEQKKWDINKLEKNLPDAIKAIYETVPTSKENRLIEVKYYFGKKEVQSIYEQTLKYDKVYSFVNLEKYYEVFPTPIGIQEKAEKSNPNREVWDILADTPKAQEVISKGYKGYNYKIVAADKYDPGFDFVIYGDNVAVIQLEEENPSVILITSKNIADGFRSVHQTMWNLL